LSFCLPPLSLTERVSLPKSEGHKNERQDRCAVWHRDKPPFDRVFGLSLGSDCKLRFWRQVSAKWERFAFGARARSIYMMSGSSRTEWKHSISAVPDKRYSITFRTVAGPIVLGAI
jgi:hypothetical protein